MQNQNTKSPVLPLTFFIPFAGLIQSLSRWRESWAKNAFWLSCVYLGAVFIFWPEGTIFGEGGDGARYAYWLSKMHNSGITLKSLLGGYLVEEHTMDLYQPLLTFLVSRFTENAHVLFMVFAIVFGFFYSRNIWYILEKLPNKKFGILFVIVASFFLVCPISQINGVRMWTALHVFVYALNPYLLDHDKSKVWWVLLTPLIHFSYLYVSIMALSYVLFTYRKKEYGQILLMVSMAIFVVTLFINTLNLDAMSSMLQEYSPESYDSRIEGYVSQDYKDRLSANSALSNWYISASGTIKYWVFSALLIMLPFCIRRNFKSSPGLVNYCIFTFLLGGFANITAMIPSGGRFRVLWFMFVVPLVLYATMQLSGKDGYKKLVNFSAIFLLLPLVVDLRKLFDLFGLSSIIGNFVTALFWDDNVPLIDYIKYFV